MNPTALVQRSFEGRSVRDALGRVVRGENPSQGRELIVVLAVIDRCAGGGDASVHRRRGALGHGGDGAPPAETDLQRHFEVTPPSVHQMVVAITEAGWITTPWSRAEHQASD